MAKTNLPNTEDPEFQRHPILKRVPRFLRPYTRSFIHAPVSHVASFLILHELTAIVPLVGIWWIIHKYQLLLPLDLPTWAIEKGTKIIDSSMEKFDFTSFSINEKFTFIMEGAYAFVIVKFLLPLRVILSLSLMPAFAKWFVIPFTKIFRKSPKPKTPASFEKVKTKEIKKPRL